MSASNTVEFPGRVDTFRGRRLPETATLAGYAALIEAYDLGVPLPRKLYGIGARHRIVEENDWTLMTPRHAPESTLEGHLIFALKYEGLDLAVLERLFAKLDGEAIEEIVRATPTGSYARRLWFLYEWLTGRALQLPDADGGKYVPVVDPDIQYAVEGTTSPRHRVRDNLPGTPDFCPLVFRTDKLESYAASDLRERAQEIVEDVPDELVARAAAFLLVDDSRSSFEIEGEHPPADRMQRWARTIGQAGEAPLDRNELLRLQREVIGDRRFIRLGLRQEGGFVGQHERGNRVPVPVHISARAEDLDDLVDGLIEFARGPVDALDPVVAAATLAFGFVYIHPFEDGNGRVHRYLIHHVLSRRDFHPPGLVFPISSAILDRAERYRSVLESYSKRLLPVIDWRPTSDGNVEVQNDTASFYRFFDATPHAEFLYECVEALIDEDLPAETDFLRRYDRFERRIEALVDMPDRTLDLLYRFLDQNDGRLSQRALDGEFSALEADEVDQIERIYDDLFAS
ncbi:MAG: Fic family protein [Persicimonas sp.]